MVKECVVKINNGVVTVVDCGGVEVQFPAINREAKYVKVLVEGGKYNIVDDNYTEELNKKTNKKTTIKEGAGKNIEAKPAKEKESEDA